MTQTKLGAKKSVAKILARDPDHFKRIGSVGGKKGRGHAFAHGLADPIESGRKGGTISRKTKKLV